MPKLTVIILTKNEEKNIAAAIKSADFADEVLVIDSGSTDATQKIALENGARFVEHLMGENGFAGQRNFALTKTDADWVFYLDADERILPETAAEIKAIVRENKPIAGRVKRLNVAFGQLMRYGDHKPDWVTRLFKRDMVHWEGVVHEGAATDCSVIKLKNPLHHYTYTDWTRYFDKFNQYTTLMADKMYARGKRASFAAIIFHPLFAWFRFYILRLGFLDGKQGFILSVNHYFYTMTKYVKLYYKAREEKQ